MMKVLLTLAFSMFFCGAAMADTVKIDIDKGTAKVKITDLDAPFKVSYTLPSGCPLSTVEEVSSATSANFYHAGQHCPNGAEFVIEVDPSFADKVEIKLADGMLDATAINQDVADLTAAVTYGTIESSTARIVPSQYNIGARAEIKKDDARLKKVVIELRSGVITL